jgi:hypothetical protein
MQRLHEEKNELLVADWDPHSNPGYVYTISYLHALFVCISRMYVCIICMCICIYIHNLYTSILLNIGLLKTRITPYLWPVFHMIQPRKN